MGVARPMRFVRLESGCLVCLSHQPNEDGYLRKTWGNSRSGDRHAEMFHRLIYRAHHGEIPEGHEVDHKCRVRLCANPDHLQALPRREHLILTNRTRYSRRKGEAKALWLAGLRAEALAEQLGVSPSTAFRWIREWSLD